MGFTHFDLLWESTLDMQGFRKIDTDAWEFANECFIRRDKGVLNNIQRRKAASPTSKGLARTSSQTMRKQPSMIDLQPAGGQNPAPALPGSMHDYSGPMHAAAADLLAFTGNPSILRHPSAALRTSSHDESSPGTSDTLQALSPPLCHQALPTQFLPLNLELAKQPFSQQDASRPAGSHPRHTQTHPGSLSPPAPPQGPQFSPLHGPQPWQGHYSQASDGLPAVERYSKMVANVLQPGIPQPASHQDGARHVSHGMDARLLPMHASSGQPDSQLLPLIHFTCP